MGHVSAGFKHCNHAAESRQSSRSLSDVRCLRDAVGVVFAIEAARAVAEAGGPSALDVINFQDEEGRFGSLTGSS